MSHSENPLSDLRCILPGVHSPFSALLAERAGAEALYLSGGALTSDRGIPDIGLISVKELAEATFSIRQVCALPLVVDADTGFGEAINVWRSVRMLEAAGADAIQIEDQRMPKRCGHLEGKELIDADAMCEKIRTAVAARRRALIVARTDARSVEGLQSALSRARRYMDEGADIIFPEALENRTEFRAFAGRVHARLIANMTEFGRTELIGAEEFFSMGYSFVLFPVTAFRAAAKAERMVYEELLMHGSQSAVLKDLMTREEQYDVIHYDSYRKIDEDVSVHREPYFSTQRKSRKGKSRTMSSDNSRSTD